ncbi:MAG TPA: sulfite exporter TauE/SafE family protein [Accumulibacter sp.]|uniref:sulfite exporter TauE/SafE family protein n=1 Tax=Accumulibacter sp. TaxID=2053492 RepID=UPI0025E01C30|nr:sulfite exporter TauE/SafE family protein [Accumulibacter sp.]MCM8597257.1 sulfite exporter TauE/SafE family protein [Accumulibacter sp.]MCM8661501.1 sulfite exporter TauE/SafE family protein [Accumulibacter sp.]HNC52664.1 sulfite exporter TauE/SafE family protein [Accumulibacter sp.]
MPEPAYFALLLIGLLGGPHCVAMCGGIVGALAMGTAARLSLHLAYNCGRIASYALAGAVAGGIGQAGMALAGPLPLRTFLYLLANLMLVALGLYLIGVTRALAFSERCGQKLWRHLQPLTRRYLPARRVAQAFPLGLLWGWLPCGLVYSALATALTSGSAWRGAGMMLAFGAGTLPNLLLAGLLAARLQAYARMPAVRVAAGLLILAFGAWGLFVGSGLAPRLLHGGQ